jgi:hypothetical protein
MQAPDAANIDNRRPLPNVRRCRVPKKGPHSTFNRASHAGSIRMTRVAIGGVERAEPRGWEDMRRNTPSAIPTYALSDTVRC